MMLNLIKRDEINDIFSIKIDDRNLIINCQKETKIVCTKTCNFIFITFNESCKFNFGNSYLKELIKSCCKETWFFPFQIFCLVNCAIEAKKGQTETWWQTRPRD